MSSFSAEQQANILEYLRTTPPKRMVRDLQSTVEDKNRPVELAGPIRRWFEINRHVEVTDAIRAEMASFRAAFEGGLVPQGTLEFENVPICGWIVHAGHCLLDGRRWWVFRVQRHDDAAPLIGPVVPAPATEADLKKLAMIIRAAGGKPKRELLRTGAITAEERADLLARGETDIAEYGQIFYWWPA